MPTTPRAQRSNRDELPLPSGIVARTYFRIVFCEFVGARMTEREGCGARKTASTEEAEESSASSPVIPLGDFATQYRNDS